MQRPLSRALLPHSCRSAPFLLLCARNNCASLRHHARRLQLKHHDGVRLGGIAKTGARFLNKLEPLFAQHTRVAH